MTRTSTLALAILLLLFAGCAEPDVRTPPAAPPRESLPYDTLPLDTSSVVTFAVASDLHLLSPRIVESRLSPGLAAYRQGERKMVLQGPALLHALLDSIRSRRPTFFLVTGDLTKDGELASHEDMADSLQTLVDAGIRVVVIPGNHDVASGNATAYTANSYFATSTVTASTFARLYRSFGYGAALSRDTASLSYVVDVAKGLRIVALDACAYRDNAFGSTSSVWGALMPSTQEWLWAQLERARRDGVDLIGAIHFNMVEHFEDEANSVISSGYMLSDFQEVGRKMAERGLHVVFTGHFHANDVATAQRGSSLLTDIETGSLITPPNRFRTGRIVDGMLTLEGRRIREIDDEGLGDTDLVVYADSFLYRGLHYRTTSILSSFGLPDTEISRHAPLVTRAWMAHYAGDEPWPLPQETQGRIRAWDSIGRPGAARFLRMLATDLPPGDLNTTISLR
jgi:3',5'-cyclic AMP phosphodiesterase CpdA